MPLQSRYYGLGVYMQCGTAGSRGGLYERVAQCEQAGGGQVDVHAHARALTCLVSAQSIDWRTQPPPRRLPGNTKHDPGKLFELPRTWNETTDSCWQENQVFWV